MSTDPNYIVDEFLNNHGYPFEISVANIFQQFNFDIQQSVYYVDPQEKCNREIDIIAIWKRKRLNKNINVVFVIECKYAATPWVLFSSLTKGFPMCYCSSHITTPWLSHLIKQPEFDTFFEIERNIGHALVQTYTTAKKENIDNAYKATQTILNFLKSEYDHFRFSSKSDFTIYVPIIVIKGKLFKAGLNSEGKIESQEIEEAQVFIKENIFDVTPKIHVLTENALEKYVRKLLGDCNNFLNPPFMNDNIFNPPAARIPMGKNSSKNTY